MVVAMTKAVFGGGNDGGGGGGKGGGNKKYHCRMWEMYVFC